jgi:hypothetical protein
MNILAIDPGQNESAWLTFNVEKRRPVEFEIEANEGIADRLWHAPHSFSAKCWPSLLVIEHVGHYGTGMPAGSSVFDTCIWIGRFIEAWRRGREAPSFAPHALLKRQRIKAVLCGSARAKDANVRQALLDLYGGSDKAAKGTKAAPGPLYGIKTHLWSALAVAVAWSKENDLEGPRKET